jgi:hypothetical protein
MKKGIIFRTILLAIAMATTLSAFASTSKEFSKEIKKTFTIDNGAKLEIINKYGTIDVRPIEGNEIRIRVEILVEAKNQSDANEIMESIDIDFYESKSFVKAETSFEESNGFWKRFKNWGKNTDSYEINYYVDAPRHVLLQLSNKYGNIHVLDMDNDVVIGVKYGNFTLGSAHDLKADVGYGKGEATHVRNLNLDIKYGQIIVDRAENVEILSKYSTVELSEAGDVKSESKYDTYRLGTVRSFRNAGKYDKIDINRTDNVEINTRYTNAELDNLGKTADFEFKYGSININDLSSGFEFIDIEGEYTDIRIYSNDKAAFEYEVDTEHTDLNVPSYTEYDSEDNKKWVKAAKNKGGGKIKIKAKYGKVRIK